MTEQNLPDGLKKLLEMHIPEMDLDDLDVLMFHIHRLYEQANYVRLADDQSLPELNLPTLTGNRSLEIVMESFAKKIRNDMVKAGFKKVEL